MDSEKTPGEPLPARPARPGPARQPGQAYEPPRILSRRSVERVTLLSSPGPIGPGSGIGGP